VKKFILPIQEAPSLYPKKYLCIIGYYKICIVSIHGKIQGTEPGATGYSMPVPEKLFRLLSRGLLKVTGRVFFKGDYRKYFLV
jgi:hypothetical protein